MFKSFVRNAFHIAINSRRFYLNGLYSEKIKFIGGIEGSRTRAACSGKMKISLMRMMRVEKLYWLVITSGDFI
jgi:hypothetical protein